MQKSEKTEPSDHFLLLTKHCSAQRYKQLLLQNKLFNLKFLNTHQSVEDNSRYGLMDSEFFGKLSPSKNLETQRKERFSPGDRFYGALNDLY